MPQLSTRLDAVNEVLDLLGKGRVTALAESNSVSLVENRLASVTRELTDKTWWFNFDRAVKQPVTAFGWSHLFPNTYIPEDRRQVSDVSRNAYARRLIIAERDGRRIYDRDTKSFVWDSAPPNLLASPFALGAVDWTAAGITVTDDLESFGGQLVEKLAGTGTLTQTVLAASFTDEKDYMVGGYCKPVGGAVQTTLRFPPNGGPNDCSITFNPTTQAVISTSGVFVDAGVIPFDSPPGWLFVYMIREWQTALSDMDVQIQQTQVVSETVDNYWTGLGLFEEDTGNGPIVDLAYSPLFEDLPHTARTYVVRRTATELNDIFGGTPQRRRHLVTREYEALAQLNEADQVHGFGNQLISSRSVARVTGTWRRRPALHNLGTGANLG